MSISYKVSNTKLYKEMDNLKLEFMIKNAKLFKIKFIVSNMIWKCKIFGHNWDYSSEV